MKLCYKCKEPFKTWIKVNGRSHNLCKRKYCLNCSPFKEHNTRKIHLPDALLKKGSRDYTKMNEEEKKLFLDKCYEYQKAKRYGTKIELVKLLGGKCCKCGYKENLSALSFHHKNPKDKLFGLDVRNLLGRKKEVVLEEAAKCDLLCANCHLETHHPDGFNWDIK